mmetsp:Transcript_2473/g.6942  ORF Transcript_2473/g.6942 Transcript_2473/m.6942 type:complete len:554 (+) Transcript_2473:93-1754(+)
MQAARESIHYSRARFKALASTTLREEPHLSACPGDVDYSPASACPVTLIVTAGVNAHPPPRRANPGRPGAASARPRSLVEEPVEEPAAGLLAAPEDAAQGSEEAAAVLPAVLVERAAVPDEPVAHAVHGSHHAVRREAVHGEVQDVRQDGSQQHRGPEALHDIHHVAEPAAEVPVGVLGFAELAAEQRVLVRDDLVAGVELPALDLELLRRGQLRPLAVAVALEVAVYAVEELLVRLDRGALEGVAQRRRQRAGRRAVPVAGVGRALVVLAARDELHVGGAQARVDLLPPAPPLRPGEGQVQACAAVAAVQHRRELHAGRQGRAEDVEDLGVDDLPGELEVRRAQGLVVAVLLGVCRVLLLPAVPREVEEEDVAGLGSPHEPAHALDDVRPGGHLAGAPGVVGQDPHGTRAEAVGPGEHVLYPVDVVDAPAQLRPRARVVAPDEQGLLPPGRLGGRLVHGGGLHLPQLLAVSRRLVRHAIRGVAPRTLDALAAGRQHEVVLALPALHRRLLGPGPPTPLPRPVLAVSVLLLLVRVLVLVTEEFEACLACTHDD